jgi:hypothetical protein
MPFWISLLGVFARSCMVEGGKEICIPLTALNVFESLEYLEISLWAKQQAEIERGFRKSTGIPKVELSSYR